MPSTIPSDHILFDAGIFIGALLQGDPRHHEAYPLVESARRGELAVCTTVGILRRYRKTRSYVNLTTEYF
jgi:predicted nucleic acid-binding protein